MNFLANCELSRSDSILFLLEPCHDLLTNFFNHYEYRLTFSLFYLGIETICQIIQQHVTLDMVAEGMSEL